METKMKVAEEAKESLLKKAGSVIEKIKEKGEELASKAKESEQVEKGKEKLDSLKAETKNLINKVTEKLPGKS